MRAVVVPPRLRKLSGVLISAAVAIAFALVMVRTLLAVSVWLTAMQRGTQHTAELLDEPELLHEPR